MTDNTSVTRVVLVAAVLLFVGVAAVAPTASACGFNETFVDEGGAEVGLRCTQPYVDLYGENVIGPG